MSWLISRWKLEWSKVTGNRRQESIKIGGEMLKSERVREEEKLGENYEKES